MKRNEPRTQLDRMLAENAESTDTPARRPSFHSSLVVEGADYVVDIGDKLLSNAGIAIGAMMRGTTPRFHPIIRSLDAKYPKTNLDTSSKPQIVLHPDSPFRRLPSDQAPRMRNSLRDEPLYERLCQAVDAHPSRAATALAAAVIAASIGISRMARRGR